MVLGIPVCENEDVFEFNFYNETATSAVPHISECYQHSVLNFIPSIFLFLFAPVTLYGLYKSDNGPLEYCSYTSFRIGVGLLLLINNTVTLFLQFYKYLESGESFPAIQLIGYAVLYVALAIAVVLTIAARNRGLITSGILFNFWLLLAICGAPELRYRWDSYVHLHLEDEKSFDYINFYSYIVYYALVILELLFSCFADTPKYKVIDKKTCPELYSSFLNQITFNWFHTMAKTGHKRALDIDDLWDLNPRDKSKHLMDKFSVNWEKHLTDCDISKGKSAAWFNLPDTKCEPKILHGRRIYLKDNPSILWPLFKTFRKPFVTGAFYKLIFDLLQFVSPQLLKHLISFIEDKSTPLWVGIGISLSLFIVAIFQSMILHQYFHNMFRLGMNIRSVLTSMVYRKALFLSNKSKKNRTVGEIVNLMSVDIQRLQDLTTFVMLFWSAPLQVILSVYFLLRLLGIAVIGGLIVLVLLAPFNYFISIKMRKCQMEQMKFKDERLKMTSEALNGIKVLKLYAWEASMQQMILEIREKEIEILKRLAFLNATTALSWSCAPFLVAVVTFGTYVFIDPENNVLTPQITFVALALFNILRFPLAIIAMIISQAVQSQVSNNRLKAFLAEDEIEPLSQPEGVKSDTAIAVKNGRFTWDETDEFKLNDINISIKKGSLVAVVGRIGCGKSSLLSAILGEMQCLDGGVAISGNVAYVPQQPWIQNMSLKKNILFNHNDLDILYKRVIDACALGQDLAALPAGDATEIGEKGINLSGGQKQRISLARAVYAQTDIYLLDDPLSAVDAHVGKHIFENVISSETGMLKYHTRVLVTHGLHYLKHCDQIIVMKNGRVTESGSYHDLISNSGEFSEILEEFIIEEAKNRARSVSFGEDAAEVREVLAQLEKLDPAKTRELQRQISQSVERLSPSPSPGPISTTRKSETTRKSIENLEKEPLINNSNNAANHNANNAKQVDDGGIGTTEKSKLIEKEGMETGKVKLSVYKTYLKAIGWKVSIVFLIIYIIASVLGVFSNLYLADWSDHAAAIQRGEGGTDDSPVRLGIYTALGLGQAFSVCIASILMALGMVIASRILHEAMLTNILRSPMSFFDVTPLGRILNRFGKDISVTDVQLPTSLINMIGMLVQAIFITIVPIIVTPSIIIGLIPITIGYLFLLRFYVSTSRQLKRLESTTRSPIYSHFQESIQGASSIRAYRCTENFLLESQNRVDYNMLSYYPSIVANRWLAVRLELVGNLIVLLSALLAVLTRENAGVTAGLVGLSVSYAFNITQTLNWAVRMTSELETNVVAVERIKEYSETPTEAALETALMHQLPKNWPTRGSVNFEDLELRYRPDLDLILKGITAHISSEEKIGIVGRTGAGKSSLMLALFRLVEPSSGRILIDGVDISTLGLNDLRSRLTIVPQDPVLFSGTLRSNLDPFKRHSDEEIWDALKLTHMDSFVATLTDLLHYKITEGGENLSVGQRQLICLARALLRKSKLLVLDEAAASVDMETDQLIQKTIKQQFADCTVLTIAHRLHTVIDSDKVMVLESGRISEFNHPQTLLHNPNSVFYSLALDAGISAN